MLCNLKCKWDYLFVVSSPPILHVMGLLCLFYVSSCWTQKHVANIYPYPPAHPFHSPHLHLNWLRMWWGYTNLPKHVDCLFEGLPAWGLVLLPTIGASLLFSSLLFSSLSSLFSSLSSLLFSSLPLLFSSLLLVSLLIFSSLLLVFSARILFSSPCFLCLYSLLLLSCFVLSYNLDCSCVFSSDFVLSCLLILTSSFSFPHFLLHFILLVVSSR